MDDEENGKKKKQERSTLLSAIPFLKDKKSEEKGVKENEENDHEKETKAENKKSIEKESSSFLSRFAFTEGKKKEEPQGKGEKVKAFENDKTESEEKIGNERKNKMREKNLKTEEKDDSSFFSRFSFGSDKDKEEKKKKSKLGKKLKEKNNDNVDITGEEDNYLFSIFSASEDKRDSEPNYPYEENKKEQLNEGKSIREIKDVGDECEAKVNEEENNVECLDGDVKKKKKKTKKQKVNKEETKDTNPEDKEKPTFFSKLNFLDDKKKTNEIIEKEKKNEKEEKSSIKNKEQKSSDIHEEEDKHGSFFSKLSFSKESEEKVPKIKIKNKELNKNIKKIATEEKEQTGKSEDKGVSSLLSKLPFLKNKSEGICEEKKEDVDNYKITLETGEVGENDTKYGENKKEKKKVTKKRKEKEKDSSVLFSDSSFSEDIAKEDKKETKSNEESERNEDKNEGSLFSIFSSSKDVNKNNDATEEIDRKEEKEKKKKSKEKNKEEDKNLQNNYDEDNREKREKKNKKKKSIEKQEEEVDKVDENWKITAFDSQVKFFDTLGSRSYDEIGKSDIFILKKKVGFATCGKPCELPSSSNYFTGYNNNQLEDINTICAKIIERSDYDPIRFSCTMLVLHYKGATCDSPIFRIETNTGFVYIDPYARVYETWEDFMKENRLPQCEYCYPLNGEYNPERIYLFQFARSPASKAVSKAAKVLDTAGSLASVAVASVSAAGLFVTVAPMVATAAGATAAAVGVYGVSRSIESLVDRNKHDQSIALSDREARSAWMSIGSSAVGVATLGAMEKARQIVESGKSISAIGDIGLQALNASAFAFSGFGFVNAFSTFGDKYKKGVLTRKDIFDMSCELLFLFNAIVSATSTTTLVNNMCTAVSSASPAQKAQMTKRHIKNFRRKKPKKSTKGLTPYETENAHEDDVSTKRGKSVVQALLLEAAKVYLPREEEISFTSQFIGHDVFSWKSHNISDAILTKNLRKNLGKLKKDYDDEINDATTRVEQYFNCLMIHRLRRDMCSLFKKASEETKFILCTKVINMEDLVEALLDDAERDIIELEERLELEIKEIPSEIFDEDFIIFDDTIDITQQMTDDDNELTPYFMTHNPSSSSLLKDTSEKFTETDKERTHCNNSGLSHETQRLFTRCGDVIQGFSLYCNDLRDFCDILDAITFVLSNDFKARMSIYKVSLETAKSTMGDAFDIDTFQKTLNISVPLLDVALHMFNKSLEDLTNGSINKIKSKYKEIKKNRVSQIIPFWENVADRSFQFYQFYGGQATGHLTKDTLMIIISKVMDISVSDKNCKIVGSEDVMMIELKEKQDVYAVVYSELRPDSTASAIIHIVK